MAEVKRTFLLRYVGPRFEGTRLPLDVLHDLPAFRDLIAAYAKDFWRARNSDRRRLPRGFDRSISFDLVAIEPGSAMPKLVWNREIAQTTLPGFPHELDELDELVSEAYGQLLDLIDGAGNESFPKSLSSEQIGGLNRFGSTLREGERIEFQDSRGRDGNIVFLDPLRRKRLITHVRDTYQARFEGVGRLLGSHIDGHISVQTVEHGQISIPIAPERIVTEFDGNINADVQFLLQIELDNNDSFRAITEVLDVEVISAEIGPDLTRCRNRLDELGQLPEGWHDGVGSAINRVALETAQRFLTKRPSLAPAYRIYPTESGGILFEFENNGWDLSVEFGPSGSVEMYGIQIEGLEELPPKSFGALEDDFFSLFDSQTAKRPE